MPFQNPGTQYQQLPTRARNEPLGPVYLNGLLANETWLRQLMSAEHNVQTGEHNAFEIPRTVVQISGTSVSGDTRGDVVSVSHPATGKYQLTLEADRFSTSMRVVVNPAADQIASKPHCTGYEVVDDTHVIIWISRLTSALGAGNSWVAHDTDFDVAIYSDPLGKGTWPTQLTQRAAQDMSLDSASGIYEVSSQFKWNNLVINAADIYASYSPEHNSDGTHNVRQVPRCHGWFSWDSPGSKYVDQYVDGLVSNYVSTGICEVTYTAKTTVSSFVMPDYARFGGTGAPGDIFRAHAFRSSTTKTTVYMYQYDTAAHTWARANCDFFLVVHGS